MFSKEIYLVVNCGSSSLKFAAYQMPEKNKLISGNFEKIGMEDSYYSINLNGVKTRKNVCALNHGQAITLLINELFLNNIITNLDEIKGVGHRVVHGGSKYSESVIIDNKVIEEIKELIPLAPLHNPAGLLGIESMINGIPNAAQVAVFDTAFHQTISQENYMYPVPYEWYEKHFVRKYGFHGTSYRYIVKTMKSILGKDDLNLIICHIGGGASISAIKNGICYNTSMGMTPLDGLMMGTRCGSIDPSSIEYINKITGASVDVITDQLNKDSGLLGITGKSDLRDIEALAKANDEKAILGLKMYINSIAKYIFQYHGELEGDVDAIVFTAGVGENQCFIRELITNKIAKVINSKIDESKNNGIASYKEIQTGIISTDDSKVPIWVIPTDEELMILEDTYSLSKNMNDPRHVKSKK